MPAITTKEIQAAFELGVECFENGISPSRLKQRLIDSFDMNSSSAHGYIEIVKHMLKGRQYTRTINAEATQYYLSTIHETYGIDRLKIALEAVRKHLEYYETTKGNSQKSVRRIYKEHLAVCDEYFQLSDFEKAVILASDDSSKQRSVRLRSAVSKPEVVERTSKYYRRNPDVVAERLFMAKGICEACKKPAPFNRKDGTPYLEVHHIKMLSDGGLDVIGNTEALCPNCHREKHFG